MCTKALRELFDVGDHEAAKCKGSKDDPRHHEWWVFRRVDESEVASELPNGVPGLLFKPRRCLRVLCRDCKADGIMGCSKDEDWEGAARAVIEPYRLHLDRGEPGRRQSIRVKDIHERRRDDWPWLTGWQYPDDAVDE